ncbi:tetratricopeptide repeat protein [Wenxinia marina]|uniref:tetratricopeptide repeat protein n=1 Tax=Wenxinia marina TaxID=390641 RepID=UPI000A77D048
MAALDRRAGRGRAGASRRRDGAARVLRFPRRARALFGRLVDYCPDYAEGYNQRAFAAFLVQDYEAALDDLDTALALNPDHVAALSGRALTLMGLGRMDEGQAALRAALALNPWLGERAMLIELPGEDI